MSGGSNQRVIFLHFWSLPRDNFWFASSMRRTLRNKGLRLVPLEEPIIAGLSVTWCYSLLTALVYTTLRSTTQLMFILPCSGLHNPSVLGQNPLQRRKEILADGTRTRTRVFLCQWNKASSSIPRDEPVFCSRGMSEVLAEGFQEAKPDYVENVLPSHHAIWMLEVMSTAMGLDV